MGSKRVVRAALSATALALVATGLGGTTASAAYQGCSGKIVNVSGPGNRLDVYCSIPDIHEFRTVAICKSGSLAYGPWVANNKTSKSATCYSGVRHNYGEGSYVYTR